MIGGQVAPGTSGNEVGENDMKPINRLGASLDQVIAVLDKGA